MINGLDRVQAHVLPDLVVGRPWSEIVRCYQLRFGVLPHAIRVVRAPNGMAFICELHTDVAGFGHVRLVGQVKHADAVRTASALVGRYGGVVMDATISAQPVHSDGPFLVMSDTLTHEAAAVMLDLWFETDVADWRGALSEGLQSERAVWRRAALEKVRGELMAFIALRARASVG